MAAENIETKLARDESRIGPNIYKNSLNTSPWNRLIKRQPWTDGMSDSIQVLTVNRNLPANVDEWTALSLNLGAGNNCVPSSDEIPTGYTLRNFNLTQKALNSIPICVNDTRNAMQASTQLRIMYKNLSDAVTYIWKRRYMLEYTRISEHKIVAAPEMPESISHFPNTPATSVLTQGMLDLCYYRLIADSAAIDGGAFAMTDGAPVFVLITDMFTSKRIRNETNTFQAMLWDAARVPELLRPLGINREYNGYFHTIETLPRHWNFTGGQWVEVQPYDEVAATNGTLAKLSNSYLTATHMDSYIYVPTVMNILVPNSISTQGSGTQFDPQSYLGQFKWLNVPSHTENAFGTWGKYHGLMETGTEPVMPQYGFVIRHLRCPSDLALTACPAGTGATASELSNLADSTDVVYGS